MTDVLMSIHNKNANNILDGIKPYEMRTTIIKRLIEGDRVYLYSTAPISKVVGHAIFIRRETYFVSDILNSSEILEKVCVTREEAEAYCRGRQYANIYTLKDPVRYDSPMALFDLGISFPPQTFRYLERY